MTVAGASARHTKERDAEMDKSTTLKAMLAVAGGLTAAVAASGPVRASCGPGGGYSRPSGGDYSQFQAPRETAEEREARRAEERTRREARRLIRAEQRAAREAAAAAARATPGETVVASNN